MPRLTDALVSLEREWRAQDMPIAQFLRPGLTAAAVTAALQDVGITPHQELMEWFSWHDGCSTYAEAGFHSRLLTLDEAIVQYVSHVLAGEGIDELYHPGWFPVVTFSTGSLAVVNCNDLERPTASTTEIDRELNLRPPEQWVTSLAIPVEWWARRFSTRLWRWNGDRIVADVDRTSIPDEERYSGLVLM
jgi:hypothetical protein